MSLGRTRRFNSSCSAVQAHNRTETQSLISLFSGWAIEGRAIRERGCRPPKGCFSTCNNTHAVARRMSSVALSRLKVEPIIAGCHKTGASMRRRPLHVVVISLAANGALPQLSRQDPNASGSTRLNHFSPTYWFCSRGATAGTAGCDGPKYPPEKPVSDVGWAVATQLSTPRGEEEAVSGTSWRSEGCTTRVEVPGSIFRLERFLRGGPSGLIAQTEEGRDRESGIRTAGSVQAVAVAEAEADVLKSRMRRRRSKWTQR